MTLLLGKATARSLALCTLLHGLDAARIDEREAEAIMGPQPGHAKGRKPN